MGSKKNYRRKKTKIPKWKKISISLLILLFAGFTGIAGVEYSRTGSIEQTTALLENGINGVESLLNTTEKIGGFLEEKTHQLNDNTQGTEAAETCGVEEPTYDFYGIPEYNGEAYVILNGNIPEFTDEERCSQVYEYYSELDYLGRCGYAEAKIGRELMPTEARGNIGSVKPTGWHTIKYDNVEGKYLYNRCHLIGYQLTAENANKKNLITGTRYLNVTGMLPWENMVADYIKETGDYVMYRVTPLYEGEDLVARGVQMEAESLGSDDIYFNIFAFNIQPGIEIDYSNGDSWLIA